MGCSNSSDGDTAADDDYDSVGGAGIKRKIAALDFSGQGLVVLPVIPKPGPIKILCVSNNFMTRLPKEMQSWTHLEEVYLSSNRFVRIPEGLLTVSNLTSLDLSNNPIARSGGFDGLDKLSKLKRLSLSMTTLKQLPSPLSRCSNLTALDLGYNQGIDLSTTDALKSLAQLNTVGLSFCALRGPLPASILNLPSLTSLNLAGNTGLDVSRKEGWGKLAKSLTTLSLGSCGLKAVPGGVLGLTNLTELNLSSNQALTSLEGLEGIRTLTSLLIADCNLRFLPLGLSACHRLQRLDLSGNEPESLDMLAKSLLKLEYLSVCDSHWAITNIGEDTLWEQISHIKTLREIEWQAWGEKGGRFVVSPYTTRFPLPLCALKVRKMNGITMREELFDSGSAAQNLLTILRDGYYKVDFGYEPNSVSALLDCLDQMHEYAMKAREFHPYCRIPRSPAGIETPSPPPDVSNPLVPPSSGASSFVSANEASSSGQATESGNLDVVKLRYIVYLYLQSCGLAGGTLLPPIDVMILHYAHMTTSPAAFADDVQAILQGMPNLDLEQLLNNRYRRVYSETPKNSPLLPTRQIRAPQESSASAASTGSSSVGGVRPIETVASMSRRLWDEWVSSREAAIGRRVGWWLRYCMSEPSNAGGDSSPEHDEGETRTGESTHPQPSLQGIVEFAWGTEASDIPLSVNMSTCLKEFFTTAHSLRKRRSSYETLSTECLTRYAKFLALASSLKHRRSSAELPQMDRDKGGIDDAASPTSPHQFCEGSGGFSSQENASDWLRPVPTTGIQLAMILHRSTPAKYKRDLALLGLEVGNLTWVKNSESTAKTSAAWMEYYEEPLIADPKHGGRRGSTTFALGGGVEERGDLTPEAVPSPYPAANPATRRRRVTISTLQQDTELHEHSTSTSDLQSTSDV